MRITGTSAVISIAVLLWSLVIGFGAWQYYKFVTMQAQLENVVNVQAQIVQYINKQQPQQGAKDAAAASPNTQTSSR